jgi:hypothetical protein
MKCDTAEAIKERISILENQAKAYLAEAKRLREHLENLKPKTEKGV